MSHSTGIPDDGDEQERSLTLNEVQEALADESHPLHERAKRENAQIATDLSGAYLNMIRRTDAAAADAFAGMGRAAADALSRVQVDLSHLQEPWAAPHSSGFPPDFDYSVPQFEVAVDPTPAKLDEMIEVGRSQH